MSAVHVVYVYGRSRWRCCQRNDLVQLREKPRVICTDSRSMQRHPIRSMRAYASHDESLENWSPVKYLQCHRRRRQRTRNEIKPRVITTSCRFTNLLAEPNTAKCLLFDVPRLNRTSEKKTITNGLPSPQDNSQI